MKDKPILHIDSRDGWMLSEDYVHMPKGVSVDYIPPISGFKRTIVMVRGISEEWLSTNFVRDNPPIF